MTLDELIQNVWDRVAEGQMSEAAAEAMEAQLRHDRSLQHVASVLLEEP